MDLLSNQRELLADFRDGRPSALDQVYRFYAKDVASMIRRGFLLGSGQRIFGRQEHQDVMDLLHETFLRAFSVRTRMAYDGLRDYRTYLFAICRNVMADKFRAEGREVLPDNDDILMQSAEEQVLEQVEYASPETMEVVRIYLEALSNDLRGVYRQRFVLAETQEKSASALGISRQQVRAREDKLRKGLYRALRKAQLAPPV